MCVEAAGDDIWDNKLQDQFLQYRSRQGTFAHSRWNLALLDDPRRPWMTMAMDVKYRTFAELALQTLSVPTGIAAVERTVSALRRVHTWERNRLAPSRVDKLVYVHQNLRMLLSESRKN